MKFLNNNKFFTINQLEGIEEFFSQINSGKYNGVGNIIPHSFNLLEVGYRSGWFSFRGAEFTSGTVYSIDTKNNISPTFKETIRFNKLLNKIECYNEDNIVDAIKNILENKKIDFIVITGLPVLEKDVCKFVEGKEILVFKLTGAKITLINGSTYKINEPKQRTPENEAWAAQREAKEKFVEERDAKEAVRVEEEATEIEKIIEDKKAFLKKEGKKITENEKTADAAPAPKRRRRTRKAKTSE